MIEERYKEGLSFGLGLVRKLFEGQSAFQKVEVFESTHHGRVLLNDGCFMLSERDERIYHEMMVHVPLNVHPYPRRVLIIGGGDGGTAREVLRHESVERCVMVEIDAMVVDACRKFIPQTAGQLGDARMDLRIEDGVRFMKTSDERFDVILIDSTDPNGAATPLFGRDFYKDVAAHLAPEGIVIAQGESVFYEQETQVSLLTLASELFPCTGMFNFTNMTYPGGLWSFLWASRGPHPLRDLRPHRLETFYYNEDVHRAAFQLPEFQRQSLKPWTTI
ncbi:MAG: polyamine aminopropyltransferase [Bdellovibrionales bacterium]|nr:polyamine aminopropyltransferase [Bdellovibrionales bacterium]